MPPTVIPATVQLRINWTYNGAPRAQNVMHYGMAPVHPVDQDTADDYAQFVDAAVTSSEWDAEMADEWTLDTISVRSLNAPNLPEFFSDVGVTGLAAANPLPAGNAVCVTLRTAKAGRSFRGRVYLPGTGESANDANGVIRQVTRDRAAAFITALGGGLGQIVEDGLVVASRALGTIETVTSVEVRDGVWDTQRRRNSPPT